MATSRNWGIGLRLIGFVMGVALAEQVVRFIPCPIFSGSRVLAQVISDGTLSTTVTSSANHLNFTVENGNRVGDNLFHSFNEFSVPTGGSAVFNNDLGIQNIISRVTGPSISNINGSIKARGTANLFLINPSGILFGPNASLNIGGSFIGSTASSIKFADGSEFNVRDSQSPPVLKISTPVGLQYGSNPIEIVNQSRGLEVQPGKTLALMGGDVRLEGGRMQAPGGRIELGGLVSPGTVGLNMDGSLMSLSLPTDIARADVSLGNNSEVDVAAGSGGSIAFNARNINVLEGSYLRAGIKPLSGASISAQAGDITLNATGATTVANSFIYNAAFDNGNGGNLKIDTRQLDIRDGVVATPTFSKGRAGDLIVNASESVNLSATLANGMVSIDILVEDIPIRTIFGTYTVDAKVPIPIPIGLFADSVAIDNLIDSTDIPRSLVGLLPQSGGDAGNLTIKTGRLILQGGALISAGTSSTGHGGDITINASEAFKIGASEVSSNTVASGDAGNVTIETGQLVLQDGGIIASSVGPFSFNSRELMNPSRETGRGGNVTVTATSVELSGTFQGYSNLPSPSRLATSTFGTGDSGDLIVNTGKLLVQNGALISTATWSTGGAGKLNVNATESVELAGVSDDGQVPSNLSTDTLVGSGNAGKLTIDTPRLIIRDGAAASVSTFSSGQGGQMVVNVSERAELFGTAADGLASGLYAQAFGDGKGGTLEINTGQLIMRDRATITVASGRAVDIRVPSARLRNLVFPVNNPATGDAGTLKVAAHSIFLENQSKLIASTDSSEGGDIQLQVRDLLRLQHDSRISASAGTANAGGNGGNIRIARLPGARFAPFIVSTALENNDITANAFNGKGGTVTGRVQGIFGFVSRSRADLERLAPAKLDPGDLQTNDISAISQNNPNLNGAVTIDTPDVDLSRELVNLPNEPVNVTVAEGCQTTSRQAIQFFDTGRGGEAVNPYEPLSSHELLADVQPPTQWSENQGRAARTATLSATPPKQIVEAQGWIVNKKGEVVLAAIVPSIPSQSGCRLR